MTSTPSSSSQGRPCPHPATPARRTGVDREGCIQSETKPPARPPTPGGPWRSGRGGPGWTAGYLARPRWPRSPTGGTCSRGAISGRAARASPHRLESTFSSSTGRRYAPSGPRPAPRLACHPARAAPSQATRCEAGNISLARLGQAGPTNPQPPWQPQAGTAQWAGSGKQLAGPEASGKCSPRGSAPFGRVL